MLSAHDIKEKFTSRFKIFIILLLKILIMASTKTIVLITGTTLMYNMQM